MFIKCTNTYTCKNMQIQKYTTGRVFITANLNDVVQMYRWYTQEKITTRIAPHRNMGRMAFHQGPGSWHGWKMKNVGVVYLRRFYRRISPSKKHSFASFSLAESFVKIVWQSIPLSCVNFWLMVWKFAPGRNASGGHVSFHSEPDLRSRERTLSCWVAQGFTLGPCGSSNRSNKTNMNNMIQLLCQRAQCYVFFPNSVS